MPPHYRRTVSAGAFNSEGMVDTAPGARREAASDDAPNAPRPGTGAFAQGVYPMEPARYTAVH